MRASGLNRLAQARIAAGSDVLLGVSVVMPVDLTRVSFKFEQPSDSAVRHHRHLKEQILLRRFVIRGVDPEVKIEWVCIKRPQPCRQRLLGSALGSAKGREVAA